MAHILKVNAMFFLSAMDMISLKFAELSVILYYLVRILEMFEQVSLTLLKLAKDIFKLY